MDRLEIGWIDLDKWIKRSNNQPIHTFFERVGKRLITDWMGLIDLYLDIDGLMDQWFVWMNGQWMKRWIGKRLDGWMWINELKEATISLFIPSSRGSTRGWSLIGWMIGLDGLIDLYLDIEEVDHWLDGWLDLMDW
jgi:hypothetical protein